MKNKKAIKVLSAFVCFLLVFAPVGALAEDDEVDISASAAVLTDASSGRILYSKNGTKQLPIASVTKIMTLNLIFDEIENGKLNLEDEIVISENAQGMGGSQVFVDAGYKYKASELIKSIIIASANDSAVAMAEHIAGTEKAFVKKMNDKASSLGMSGTVFKNCTGLPENGHFSTAEDVAVMSRELLCHSDFFLYSTTWTDKLYHAKDGRTTELVNTNKLIRSLSGCDGIKTGSTGEAGFCVSVTAERDGMRLISVILGGETSKSRFTDAANLINYGFAAYDNNCVVMSGEKITEVSVKNGKSKSIALAAEKGLSVTLKDGEEVEKVILTDENVEAPIKSGDRLGTLKVLVNGELLAEIPLVADGDCKKATFIDRFLSFISGGKR